MKQENSLLKENLQKLATRVDLDQHQLTAKFSLELEKMKSNIVIFVPLIFQ